MDMPQLRMKRSKSTQNFDESAIKNFFPEKRYQKRGPSIFTDYIS